VNVGEYDFSLWTGPTLEAQFVTVAEDPRFGYEYFMRADSLRARLGWKSLLRGHIELETLSLTRPSLNVVRDASGDWNIGEWLPKPGSNTSQSSSNSGSNLRFKRIDVEGGRINFKQSDAKLPFAFVDVTGRVETDIPGRWRLNLDATPWRPAVLTQQAGTVHVSGQVGGTSSRLLPAALDISWTDASVSDVLRLARGDDYGVRGNLGLILSAKTEGSVWDMRGRAEIRQLHRWDLAVRGDNPSLNVIAQMKFDPRPGDLELTQATFEAPHSNAQAFGKVFFGANQSAEKTGVEPFSLTLSDSAIDLNDVLTWVRAFHGSVADTLSLQGLASISGSVSGWPPRLESADIVTRGADLVGQGIRVPVHLGAGEFRYDHGQASLLPLVVSFGLPKAAPEGAFRIDALLRSSPKRPSFLHLAGNIAQVRDLKAAAGMFGWNFSRGWDVAGPFRCDLRWQAPPGLTVRGFWGGQPVGSIDLGEKDGGEAYLRAPFLNLPIEAIEAHADLRTGTRHIDLGSAQAFGAEWTGTFDRNTSSEGWQFSLTADHLATADIDRWINPRWRESFLDRVLPFFNAPNVATAAPEDLRASGHLTLDEFSVSRIVLEHFQGNVSIAGRHLELADARGEFYGGELNGALDAELQPIPTYRSAVTFSGVDLPSMTESAPQLSGLFAGSASGDFSFVAQGATRPDLLASLECQGSAEVQGPELENVNLVASLQSAALRQGKSLFREASAAFSCQNGKVAFQNLSLIGSDAEIDGKGTVDFSRTMNFQLQVKPGFTRGPAAPIADAVGNSGKSYQLTGRLDSPQLALVTPPHRAR